jgi:hypothetical protein
MGMSGGGGGHGEGNSIPQPSVEEPTNQCLDIPLN